MLGSDSLSLPCVCVSLWVFQPEPWGHQGRRKLYRFSSRGPRTRAGIRKLFLGHGFIWFWAIWVLSFCSVLYVIITCKYKFRCIDYHRLFLTIINFPIKYPETSSLFAFYFQKALGWKLHFKTMYNSVVKNKTRICTINVTTILGRSPVVIDTNLNLLATKTKQSSGSMTYLWQKNAKHTVLEGNVARIDLEAFPPWIRVWEIITDEE